MKTQMMCLIAALSIFTLPVDAVEIANQSIPITLSVPVVCAGEVVDLSGTLDTVITFRHRGPRSRRLGLHVNQMVAGTGEITGRGYQADDEINIPFNKSLLNGQGTISFNTTLEVTSEPPDGSFIIRFWLQETVHVTFNADGTVTVNVDNFNVDCGDPASAGFWDY
jgi:hypothetical protein